MIALPLTLPRSLTFNKYLVWALAQEDYINAELADGKIELQSSAAFAHQDLSGWLLGLLSFFVERQQTGEVLFSRFLMKLNERTAREPDILFIANANLHRLREYYLEGPADLAIEIVSPESQTRDLQTKLEEYRQGGVREYWALNPMEQTPQFWQLQPDGTYLAVALDENGVYHSAVMAGLWINVNWLWQNPLPPILDVLRQWSLV